MAHDHPRERQQVYPNGFEAVSGESIVDGRPAEVLVGVCPRASGLAG